MHEIRLGLGTRKVYPDAREGMVFQKQRRDWSRRIREFGGNLNGTSSGVEVTDQCEVSY